MDLYHLRQGLHVIASFWDYHGGAKSRVSVRGNSVRFRVCDIPAQGLIGLIRILISTNCNFFSRSPSQNNSKVKRAWLRAMGDRPGSPSRVRMSEDKVRMKDMCWFARIFLGSYRATRCRWARPPGPGLREAGRYRKYFSFGKILEIFNLGTIDLP
jgi:hypothetical protein